jgi:hypothetical protein
MKALRAIGIRLVEGVMDGETEVLGDEEGDGV